MSVGQTAIPTDISLYCFVDTASGGVANRNNVKRIDEVDGYGKTEQYAGWQRATSALIDWLRSHVNEAGNPTVAGFNGPTWAPALVLDFDGQDKDPSNALPPMRRLLAHLDDLGVDLRIVRVYFSGRSGFHVELPAALFGGWAPSVDQPAYLRQLAGLLMDGIPFDSSTFDRTRLLRLENTRHGGSGLFKVRLTARESLTAEIADILALAKQPRETSAVPELAPISDDDIMPCPELVELWRQAQAAVDQQGPTRQRVAGQVTDEERERLTVASIAAAWPHGGQGASRHADYLMPLSGFLVGKLGAEQAEALLAAAIERAGDPDFVKRRDWQSELRRLISSAASRQAHGQGTVGLPTLGEKFAALAAVLAALWPTPTTLEPVAKPDDVVLPFPTDALPPVLRDLVEHGTRNVVCPPDFIGTPLLAHVGAAIGDALELEIKPGWREGANLYCGVIGDPGSKKSPAAGLAGRALHQLQQRLARQHAAAAMRYEQDLLDWESSKKDAERGPKPEAPAYPHLVTTDATTEALWPMILAGKGVSLELDELSGWVRSMDMYRGGRGADRQHFLSAWSRRLVKVDRKGNPIPIIVPRPFLAVTGGIQPDILPDLVEGARGEDGFMHRLLLAYPDPVANRWSDHQVPAGVLAAVDALTERLYQITGTNDPVAGLVPKTVRLGDEARALFQNWYERQAAEMSDELFPTSLRGPWAKMPSQLARITLILHAASVEPLTYVVERETVEAAIRLVEYFESHARRVYRRLARGREDLTVKLLTTLKQQGPTKQVDLLKRTLQRNVPAERLKAVLEGLEEAGLVSRVVERGAGRPATIWRAA